MEYFDILNEASDNVGLKFDQDKYDQFMLYKDLIKEWNEKINLTAIKEDEAIVQKHFIDSMKVFKFDQLKNAKNVIDIGTGGGFPGIPMKIIKPEVNIVLLDSLNKRIIFLNEVINRLDLKNIKAIHGRAEDFAQEKQYREKFDVAVSRAVANLTVLSEYCIPYVKVGGYFVAMKGPAVEEEIKLSKNAIRMLGGQIEHIEKVQIEGSDLKHNLVIIKKISQTHKKYPRKAGMVAKVPLF
ncbi:16S rRNA (guanine(527)-N(7))-methyltransferase RsmG [Clostridium estertheticum]|uniref:Ribosomal RNA small subunit methyltransferase G n=2 Tax=Clostridium estertheticum TaxID=238834 RepID=A0A1J0GM67_9CLOT|nr:16S rRNA (guanine(527)-N(7))-methyltransferase RsmG [Clostridium estertheticum]APC42506.1 16S rRNA methyltransferase G [Clostridium estertheticum subsp. estertheticum]MBU3075646.1 16S rRNA (guanine(527)-N(7))-methyltransferase RsmG [Clostridium estertheticum]MBU3164772.1 16S rRNA (guanine(527)-N(7))-methyltransferase RsmG [Clostridium estertheticum]MBZ9615548.1 16S rRNA (guanine(527)-N(7))-methyltransferase RsmG [Clostridium estertheticum subsp. laramiense]MCB2343162.1 16S rRNA (guanine(527